jgi:DNA mismatch repair protein MutL
VTHYALAHPEVHFLLKTPSQEMLNCVPVERLADRVYQVFGRQALAELVEIPTSEGPVHTAITEAALEPDESAATIRVTGFTSRPEVQRSNRNGIYIFVNRRLVRDRLLLHAIGEAYRNIIPPGTFPTVLLFLELPHREVDVNVHPAKIEVRFRHPQFVHDFTRDAIRHALSLARSVPGFPAAQMQGEASLAATAASATGTSQPGSAQSGPFRGAPFQDAPFQAGPFPGPPRAVIPSSLAVEDFGLSAAPDRPIAERFGFDAGLSMNFPMPRSADAGISAPGPQAEAVPVSGSLPSAEDIANLKPLGQVSSSFIVAVNGEGLWIIDQHVAHERVLFEQHSRARREGAVSGQRLLVPIVVDLDPRQLAIFEQIEEELAANGFEAGLAGGRSVAIHAAPAGIASSETEKLLYEILDGVARENQAISIDSLQSQIAASTSCHAAIKVNTPLDQKKMEWLLGELAKTEYPMSCPHGRPVVLRYSVREIERAFKRI